MSILIALLLIVLVGPTVLALLLMPFCLAIDVVKMACGKKPTDWNDGH